MRREGDGERAMIRVRAAANTLLLGLAALAVFHVLMLLRVLPADVAWGGRVAASGDLAALEAASLVVTLFFAVVVAAKAGHLGPRVPRRAVSITMWVVFGYLTLNVAGNLASASSLERAVFTPVSVVLALLALRVATGR